MEENKNIEHKWRPVQNEIKDVCLIKIGLFFTHSTSQEQPSRSRVKILQ